MLTTVSRRPRAVAPPRASISDDAERSAANGGAGDTHAHRAAAAANAAGSDAPSNTQRAGVWLTAAAAAAAVVAAPLAVAPCALADFKTYNHAYLRGADMSNQDLYRSIFAACDCRLINLSGSNLAGSTDTFAGFELANLENTNCKLDNLRGASRAPTPLLPLILPTWGKPTVAALSEPYLFPSDSPPTSPSDLPTSPSDFPTFLPHLPSPPLLPTSPPSHLPAPPPLPTSLCCMEHALADLSKRPISNVSRPLLSQHITPNLSTPPTFAAGSVLLLTALFSEGPTFATQTLPMPFSLDRSLMALM
ncbi:unnamed protein product [Closterium sp. Naga37s-1]|nr:unnamed protein product [Closterium sp. Naga37s-1]